MDRYKSLIVDINFFFLFITIWIIYNFYFVNTHFSVINFNLSVNLSTFKIFNPRTWKSLSFTNFSFFFFFFLWVKSYSLVFILLFNDTLMKSLFVNLVTKHEKISYIIILSNLLDPHIRLTLILSLFTLCIRKVKCHVLSPQNAHSFSIFSFQN